MVAKIAAATEFRILSVYKSSASSQKSEAKTTRVPNRRASVAVWGGVASLDRRGSARRRNRSTGQTQPFCCSFTASRRLITDVVFVNTFEKGTIHTRDSRSFEPAAAPSGRHPCGVRSDPLPTDRAGAARPSMSSPVPYSPETHHQSPLTTAMGSHFLFLPHRSPLPHSPHRS